VDPQDSSFWAEERARSSADPVALLGSTSTGWPMLDLSMCSPRMRASWLGGPRTSTAAFGRDSGRRGCSQMCDRDTLGWARRRGTCGPVGLGRRASGERAWTVCDVSRGTHNPEVAGSNPAPLPTCQQQRPGPMVRAFCCSRSLTCRFALKLHLRLDAAGLMRSRSACPSSRSQRLRRRQACF
jgi:hypothetical protein